MKNASNIALRGERDGNVDALEEGTIGMVRHGRVVKPENGQSFTLFDGVQLQLRDGGDSGRALHVELDLKLKGTKSDDLDDDVEEEESDDAELGIEDEEGADEPDEDEEQEEDEEDQDEGARESELSAEDEEDFEREAVEHDEEEEGSPEDSIIDDDEEFSSDEEEELAARSEDDDEAREDDDGDSVTAGSRDKGAAGFTYAKSASIGARDTATEPKREQKALPWVSVRQVQWAAKHTAAVERAARPGPANPRGDVQLVQRALAKVMGTQSKDPAGFFEADTQRLFHRFRTHKLKFRGIPASAAPGAKGLTALGRLSKLFRVRTGLAVVVPTTPAKLNPHDVTFTRCTTASSPDNIGKWVRQACRKAGVSPSSAWVKGYTTIIKRESGGNPNACNVWDSNAKTPPGYRKVKDFGDGYTRHGIVRLNGRPTHFQCSRGIVQCIPQTFAQHHARGTSRSIYDPVASIAASIRYVCSRYAVAKNGSNLAAKVQQADPTRPPKGY